MHDKSQKNDAMLLRRLWLRVCQMVGVYYQKSYSQCGEDLIVSYIFDSLKIAHPTYLDIGAHHPYFLSNTFLFYRRGSRGVCIEPDPFLFDKISKSRRRDQNLNVGLAGKSGTLRLHVFSSRTLNTFSGEEAKKYIAAGHEQIDSREIVVLTFEDVMSRCFDTVPDFISLDVEGMDMEIIDSIDFTKYRPGVFCIETITYSRVGEGKKLTEIDEIMSGHNYMKYADTYINSIYVDRDLWRAHT